MTNREKYRQFCEMENIPIYSQAWWLDSVSDSNNWDVVIVEKNNEIIATLPYIIKKRYYFSCITMPPLTPMLGPWLRYPADQKYSKKLEYEKKVLTELIEKIPSSDSFYSVFDYHITHWLPFYWKGFQCSTHYTYVIENLSDINRLYNELSTEIKNQLREAEKIISCEVCHDAGEFYRINKMTFDRQGMDMSYSLDFFKKLVQAAEEHHAGRMYMAKDNEGRIHAVAYMVWDENCAYYLLGGADPELRKSSAQVFLLWQMIQDAAKVAKSFDFEGTMLPQVNRMFRNFATKQMPYFHITKTFNKYLATLKYLQAAYRTLKG